MIRYRASLSKPMRDVNVLDASHDPESRTQRQGMIGANVNHVLSRVKNLRDIRHASQAVCIYGDITRTTLYTSHLATCVGLAILCPRSKRAALAHISDYFVGVLASERAWGQRYLANMLSTVFQQIGSRDDTFQVLIAGASNMNTDDQVFEKLFLTYGIYMHGQTGSNFFLDFEAQNADAISAYSAARQSLNASEDAVFNAMNATAEMKTALTLAEKKLARAQKAIRWPPRNARFEMLRADDMATLVTQIPHLISTPVMHSARRLASVGIAWAKNTLARGMNAREARARFFPNLYDDTTSKFINSQIEGANVLIDYLQNLESSMPFTLLPDLNLEERVDGTPLSMLIHLPSPHSTSVEVVLWREDVSGEPVLHIPSRGDFRTRDYTLGPHLPVLRRRGVFLMNNADSVDIHVDRDMLTIPGQNAIVRKYAE